ncbi:hypothetical protein WOLCODRAFT_95323 [Wolfiporia cocos MD-104 SS10]|uniref:separase n=1 Tax=Wolfiporia cocos (strain MD-104) TaxID=742152 RepID=A0A2H3J3K2_WOLCO|nr:hypothetical protein WOLCODRAFT_95323 [Wolfiporia cocos MD-104 SS10]
MPSAVPRTRSTSSRPTRLATRTKSSAVTPDELASDVAAKLTITQPDSKGKIKDNPSSIQSREALRHDAMRAVNAASKTLSAQLDHQKTPVAATRKSELEKVAMSARDALRQLRELNPQNIDTERAASNIVGKLVSLELNDPALAILEDMRPGLVALYVPMHQPSSKRSMVELLTIPFPPDDTELPEILLTLLATYLLHSLTIYLHRLTNVPTFIDGFADPSRHTLLTWAGHFTQLPQKHHDALFTRAYTALTKAALPQGVTPFHAFRLKVLALRCLACTRPGLVQPDNFWEQLVRWSRTYASEVDDRGQGGEARESTLKNCSEAFEEAIGWVRDRSDAGEWMCGRGFVLLCECWVGYAKQAGDLAAIDRIMSLLRSTQSSKGDRDSGRDREATSSSRNPDRHNSLKDMKCFDEISITTVCAALAQASTLFEQWTEQNMSTRVQAALDAIRSCQSLLNVDTSEGSREKNSVYLRDKVRRALERLRRALLGIVESPVSNPRSGTSNVQKSEGTRLLCEIADVQESTVRKGCGQKGAEFLDADMLTWTLETLLVLGRTALAVRDPSSYASAWGYLQRAKALVSDSRPESGLEDRSRNECTDTTSENVYSKLRCTSFPQLLAHANYTRCVAGAFHNIAGTLYQAERYSHAVRFLEEGCAMGTTALAAYHGIGRTSGSKTGEKHDAEETREKESESWRHLEEHLWRRWELLGVCQAKTSDRKLAYDAFIAAIKAFPFNLTSLEGILRSNSVKCAFSTTSALQQLGTIVDRVTYMAACELFLDPSTLSAKSWFMNIDMNTDSWNSIVGSLLERQIASLSESRWKPNVHRIMRQLVQDALNVYDSLAQPIRHARVLLQALELEYYAGEKDLPGHFAGMPVEAIESVFEPLTAPKEAVADAGLLPFCAEYTAKLHLWLALCTHLHPSVDAVSASTIAARHGQSACQVLRKMVAPSLIPDLRQSLARLSIGEKADSKLPLPKVKRATAKKGTRAVTGAKSKIAPPRTRARKEAVLRTPQPKKADAADLGDAPTMPDKAASARTEERVLFDDFPHLINLISMVSQFLGLQGHLLVKVQLLNAARRLSEQQSGVTSSEFIDLSFELAHEYLKLGKVEKAKSIHSQMLIAARGGAITPEVCAVLFLRHAEALAVSGQILKGSSMYCEATALSESLPKEERGMSTAQRLRLRAKTLERTAIAARAFSVIQFSRDDPTASLEGLLQSLRLFNRALDTVSRLRPSTVVQSEPDNPFEVKTNTDAQQSNESSPLGLHMSHKQPQLKTAMDSLEWRLAEGLLETLFSLFDAYLARGSPREAEYFIQQARDLAESLGAQAMISRALARRGELLLQLGLLEEGHDVLLQATELVVDLSGPDAANIRRIRGDYSQRSSNYQDARQLYDEAAVILNDLTKTFSTLDGASLRQSLSVRPRASMDQSNEILAPSILAAVLRKQISMLHEAGEDYKDLLARLSSVSLNTEGKAEGAVLSAKLTLDDVYTRFRADMLLSSLAESTIAIPMGTSDVRSANASSAAQEISNMLSTAEESLSSDLALIANRGNVPHVRETSISLALISALRTMLNSGTDEAAPGVARLIDASIAITLRREILEAIKHKLLDPAMINDLHWPRMTPNGSPIARTQFRHTHRAPNLGDSDDEESCDHPETVSLEHFWQSLYSKYQGQTPMESDERRAGEDVLPLNWTVIHVSITEDQNLMFITRQEARREPLVFCLPLKGRREDNDNVQLTYDDAISELKEILRLNDEGTRQAGNVKREQKSARAAWWADRYALDKRLQDFLINIEFCWLGAFKTVFHQKKTTQQEDLVALQGRIDRIFTKCILARERNQCTDIKLDDSILECISSLPPDCRDEELEDVIYFVLDLYQFHGFPIAVAEVDIDQAVIDLRTALEEHTAKVNARGLTQPVSDGHTFLILDKNIQGIPWESLPCLRGQSVSRIPNMDFLVDRLQYARQHSMHSSKPDRFTFNPTKTYYVLNPSGDLKGTEGRFAGWLTGMKAVGWDGVIGRAPSEQQMCNALTRNDLVIYFGHGGAEQYVRSQRVRHLPRCAATMLWGCSSGALREMGDFDRVGTPYNYMLAGCPTLIANLWDVTDRDIDKFSQAVFDDLQLTTTGMRAPRADDAAVSVITAVAKARDNCKLKYLTGAAPVVYGIPFYL